MWGGGPGVLAVEAVKLLKTAGTPAVPPYILDIGCGYGRDTFYVADTIACRVLGIDVSEKAIEMAKSAAAEAKRTNVEFRCAGFTGIGKKEFDIVFVSNLYQILHREERAGLRQAVMSALKPGGMMFLCTLSTKDPEHYGKGEPVPGDTNSYKDAVYLHFCTGEELLGDFGFLTVDKLYEHEYHEPRAAGAPHHHVSWILMGRLA